MARPRRHFGMDWLRIGAFALLILYHIGMYFVHWDWHVKTVRPLEWVAVPMLATNAWRLGLLFVVSGYASAALFARLGSAGAFWRERSGRLLVPLAAAMVLVVPLQPWVELQFKHGYRQSFAAFWLHDYFRFAPLEGIMLPTWNHLWFVAYVYAYTLLLAALMALPRRVRAGLRRRGDLWLGDARVVLVPLLYLLVRLWLSRPGSGETHDFVGDGLAHTLWLPMFAFGFLLRDGPHLWRGIRRWWIVSGAAGLAGYAVVAGAEIVWPGNAVPPAEAVVIMALARVVQMWGTIIALLGAADRYWNHDHPWRATLAEAVFAFYMIHQTIIVGVGWALRGAGLGCGGEWLVLLTATTTGCWAFYLLGRSIPWARLLIGLKPQAKGSRAGD